MVSNTRRPSRERPIDPVRVVALNPPGRFPTTVADTGRWWSVLEARRPGSLARVGLNVAWWRRLCSAPAIPLLAPGTSSRRPRLLGRDLGASAQRASAALDRLQDWQTYRDPAAYLGAAEDLGAFVEDLNRAQTALRFGLAWGVRVNALAYDDSLSLRRYAQCSSPLADLVEPTLDEIPEAVDLAVMAVVSPEELLTAMIVARLLRRRSPDVHVCLADHSQGSFSLTPHTERLVESGALTSAFDTIVVRREERDELVPAIAAALERGEAPAGFVRRGDLPASPSAPVGYAPPPPVPTFAPEPVLRTRSQRRALLLGSLHLLRPDRARAGGTVHGGGRARRARAVERVQTCGLPLLRLRRRGPLAAPARHPRRGAVEGRPRDPVGLPEQARALLRRRALRRDVRGRVPRDPLRPRVDVREDARADGQGRRAAWRRPTSRASSARPTRPGWAST